MFQNVIAKLFARKAVADQVVDKNSAGLEPAEWAAGYLFGVTGRVDDKRAELNECFTPVEGLKELIDDAMNSFENGDYKAFDKKMNSKKINKKWAKGMKKCKKVNPDFDTVNSAKADFLARDDAEDLMTANYLASKNVIDGNGVNALATWHNGLYFDASMFLGENWATLSKVPAVEVVTENDDTVYDTDPAEYLAGYVYGVTGRYEDRRSEIVACWSEVDGLTDKIDAAMQYQAEQKWKEANDTWATTHDMFAQGVSACDTELLELLGQLDQEKNDFIARDDASNTMKANYEANKDFIDTEAGRAIVTWSRGVYFDTGMFQGEVWAALTQ